MRRLLTITALVLAALPVLAGAACGLLWFLSCMQGD